MEKQAYYLDSCIWLNLFKKEENQGINYWRIALDFLEKCGENGNIIVSTIVLKEISFKLGEKFLEVKQMFNESGFIKIMKTTSDDYVLARIFEQDHRLLSFYDYLHVAIAKRLAIPLITRDKDLIEFAKKYVVVYKPEELIR